MHLYMYYRNLQFQFSKTVKPETNWDNTLNLNSDSLTDIFWWSSCSFPLIPYSIKPFNEDFILHTDASNSGWGGQLSSVSATSGTWSDEESSQHINYLGVEGGSSLCSIFHIRTKRFIFKNIFL